MNTDLKIIKKKFGEDMMKLCRQLFPTILEQKGALSQIMLEKFEPSHELYNDIISNKLDEEFKNYIYASFNTNNVSKEIKTTKTPRELLNEAGYDLYECHTEDDIQSFRKYYSSNEKICTFRGERLKKCYVFFAVKKNVDEINRMNFSDPKRQDLYGTSVLSIQFTKDEAHTLSIKNRYNHSVDNPDATFSNNLDNIIPGLTRSFERCYGMIQKYKSPNFEIPNYVCIDGKCYKYNYEINNKYYCRNNIIVDNFKLKKLDKSKYVLLDYYILNLETKKIYLYDKRIDDSFVETIDEIKKVEIEKDGKERKIKLETISGDVFINLDQNSNIIYYQNDAVEKIGDYFMLNNNALKTLKLSNVETIEDYFLYFNKTLKTIELPNVKKICSQFMHENKNLEKIHFPLLRAVGRCFLDSNIALESVELPNIKEIDLCFLYNNEKLKKIYLPQVEKIGKSFLSSNKNLQSIELPNVVEIESSFLYNNENLKRIYLPLVEKLGDLFLYSNKKLEDISLPKVEKIGMCFLGNNEKISRVYLPQVKTIASYFLTHNKCLDVLELPNLEKFSNHFMDKNNNLKMVYLPKIERIPFEFLHNQKNLEVLNLPLNNYIDQVNSCVIVENDNQIKCKKKINTFSGKS